MRKLLALSIVFAAMLPLVALADGPKDGQKPEGPRHHGPQFLQWDQNKDGFITKDELPAGDKRAEGFFNKLDKNKDGKVCKKEIGDFFQEMKARHEERAKQAGKDDMHRHAHAGKPGACPFPQMDPVKAADRFFGKADLNKDGSISKEELTKFFVEGQKKFKEHMEKMNKDGKKPEKKAECSKDGKKPEKKAECSKDGKKPEKKAECSKDGKKPEKKAEAKKDGKKPEKKAEEKK